jgi:hypothetical protein
MGDSSVRSTGLYEKYTVKQPVELSDGGMGYSWEDEYRTVPRSRVRLALLGPSLTQPSDTSRRGCR